MQQHRNDVALSGMRSVQEPVMSGDDADEQSFSVPNDWASHGPPTGQLGSAHPMLQVLPAF